MADPEARHEPSTSRERLSNPPTNRPAPVRTNTNNSANLSSPSSFRRSPVIQPLASSAHSLASLNTQGSRRDASLGSSPSVSKRSSYAENLNLRNYPGSPRNHRTSSFSGQALQDLLMSPNKSKFKDSDDERFKGRDWRTVQVAEIIDPAETRFVELNSSIEECTKLLCRSGAPNVVLIRESHLTKTAIGAFDFSDLNAYLLLVLGLAQPDEEAPKIAERARLGEALPLSLVLDHLGPQEEPVAIPHTANLQQAMVVLGSGNHRVVINKEGTSEAAGILTQLRLVRFFWENHNNFTATEKLYALTLKELELGVKEVISINGDKPLSDALHIMHNRGITSLPVLDNQRNVVGNISHVDVRLLTDTSAIPLLSSTCIHFISVILSERGISDGKDAYPVFHVTPYSSLAHTVAKLCATRSHRMWIVDAPSPSTSVPPSPAQPHSSVSTFALPPSSSHAVALTPTRQNLPPVVGATDITPGPPYTSTNPVVAVSAGSLPGQGMSGRLSGVVSLTDILNLFARASGLSPGDPEAMRSRRRRQSSSSSSASAARPSLDSVGRSSWGEGSAEAAAMGDSKRRSMIGILR